MRSQGTNHIMFRSVDYRNSKLADADDQPQPDFVRESLFCLRHAHQDNQLLLGAD